MRRQLLLRGMVWVGALLLSSCAGGSQAKRSIEWKDLPSQTQHFMERYYAGAQMEEIELAPTDTLARYLISLDDRTLLQFDSVGRCTGVENYLSGVPEELIPPKIAHHSETIFPGTLIVAFHPSSSGDVVTLDNGVRLFYDFQENFLRYDEYRKD